MPTFQTREELEAWYEEAAQAYLRSLSLEHFMEATAQATQREITLESFALVKPHRRDLHVFNELLVQFQDPARRRRRPRQVVPDNMLILYDGEIEASGSYNLELQPARPFCVLEYVSKHNARKDYDDNMEKYEQQMKVPYYLLFYPDNQELTLYRHNGDKYVTVLPNEQERYSIAELELEVALRNGWVRYWFRGKLLPLPAEMQRDLEESRRQGEEDRKRADKERKRADKERDRADKAQTLADKEYQNRVTAELEVERLHAELLALRKQRGEA